MKTLAAHIASEIAATVIAGGFSMFIIVAAFVAGLLGWLLIMRKRVLQCPHCGAVVPAS